jgi:hypothetical protein
MRTCGWQARYATAGHGINQAMIIRDRSHSSVKRFAVFLLRQSSFNNLLRLFGLSYCIRTTNHELLPHLVGSIVKSPKPLRHAYPGIGEQTHPFLFRGTASAPNTEPSTIVLHQTTYIPTYGRIFLSTQMTRRCGAFRLSPARSSRLPQRDPLRCPGYWGSSTTRGLSRTSGLGTHPCRGSGSPALRHALLRNLMSASSSA